ncbi:hypothetical protein BC940DRAFT_311479 [Gongronella butleri]|nr:hypothetical protein BC940DRAFT_311479 [Gongronella butleri]
MAAVDKQRGMKSCENMNIMKKWQKNRWLQQRTAPPPPTVLCKHERVTNSKRPRQEEHGQTRFFNA